MHIGYSPGEHRSFTSADNSQTSLAKTPARCWDWSPVSPLCLLPCPFSPGSHSSRVSKRWAVGRWRPEHTSSLIQEYCGALWAEMRSHFLGVLAGWRGSALPCSALVLGKYISKLSTHFPAGEMEASVMEGRESGWPEGPLCPVPLASTLYWGAAHDVDFCPLALHSVALSTCSCRPSHL